MKTVIYQMFTRLFGNLNHTNRPWGTLADNGSGKFNNIDAATLRRIRELGATHVWYTGVLRHASVTDYSRFGIPRQHPHVVKGIAGSPYAVCDYYDVDPDLAVDVARRMDEWEALVARTHRARLKVVMDFVPNHVARQYQSIAKPAGAIDLGEADNREWHFSVHNNFYYCWGQPLDLSEIPLPAHAPSAAESYREQPARATGNDRFNNRPTQNDWYETVKLNYGIDYCDAGGRSNHFDPVPDTWQKMTDILLFWASKGVDAFRCDMAEMVPAEFWAWATAIVKRQHPDIFFIGEVYNPSDYRRYIAAGFDLLYDKVGMYDCLRDVVCGRRPASAITYEWEATDDIRSHMLYFLENHDEQRAAGDYFAGDARRALPAFMVCAWLQQNPVMLYAGQEFGERGMQAEGFSGQDGRTTIFDYWSPDSLRHGYYQRHKMTPSEKALEQRYRKILTVARTEKAIADGSFFDLMYAQGAAFDRRNLYAFMRKAGHETLLIVINFADSPLAAAINLPRHAFDYLGMTEGVVTAKDVMTGRKCELELAANVEFSIKVPALGSIVLKFKS